MCESPGSHPKLITESKSITVNILAVHSLTEISAQGDSDSSSHAFNCQNNAIWRQLAVEETGQWIPLKGPDDQKYSFRGPVFSSLTHDWVVYHIWFCSRTLFSGSHPRLPDLKGLTGMWLISKVLSSLKESGTRTCLCSASVISQELMLLFFLSQVVTKKTNWYTPQHHTKHKQPLKSCLCTNLSLTLAWNWQAKLLNLIVRKNKEKAVLSFIIIIPHYHTELLRACRRRLHWASSTLQVLSDPGNGEIHLCWRWHVPSWSRHDRFIACFAIYRHSRRWSGHDIPLQGSAAHW